MSNTGLYKAFDEKNIDYIKTDVGDKYVYEAMQKGGYCLGGEESGHVIFSKFASTGDGLISAIKIMEVFIESKLPSSRLCAGLEYYPQITKNIRVDDKDAAVSDSDVLVAVKYAEDKLGDDGKVLLRKSGTEPVVRVTVEAKGEDLCRTLADRIAGTIIKKGYEVK